ncbi:MAG: THUMP domain-containing protein [Bacteroidales bacterium]|nr:RNA methyltransferase [Lentimicrobiaceae bacterium]MDD5694329.1 THUMP domain-containing protein [Bacteroidales bacterium]
MKISENPKLPLVATTISGLEIVLAEELRNLGAEDIQVLNRAVSFTGTRELVYRANFWCRTAFHILRLIASFPVRNQRDLYDQLHDMHWEDWINPDRTLAVHAVVYNAVFTHTQFAEQLSKDAIVDRFRSKYGRRPSVDLISPFLRIHIHLSGENCQVLVDSSGDSLHKRGYRTATGLAPLNEVLAAGLIRLSEWDGTTPFFDPMCGSGTLLIEAAMMASNLPPGHFRKNFAFCNWPDFDENKWEKISSDFLKHSSAPQHNIRGADLSSRMVSISKQNISYAGFENMISVLQQDFHKADPPSTPGMMITNPPFGQRLTVDNLQLQYKQIGDTLKKRYPGWTVWLLASDKQAIKFLGLKPSRKFTVFNGPLECKFVNFEVFEGSRKDALNKQP